MGKEEERTMETTMIPIFFPGPRQPSPYPQVDRCELLPTSELTGAAEDSGWCFVTHWAWSDARTQLPLRPLVLGPYAHRLTEAEFAQNEAAVREWAGRQKEYWR